MDGALRISKSRACNECKKHKIKCERKPGESKCVRCLRHGHRCESSNQLQRLIEDDSDWKKSANAQTLQLQAAVSELLQRNLLPPLSNYGSNGAASQPLEGLATGPSPGAASTMAMTRENSQEPEEDAELVSAPMRSLYEVTKLRNLRSNPQSKSGPITSSLIEEDFISRGALPLDEATKLFAFFNQTMNQFLWGGIALVHPDLASVRKSSSLLTSAILAVAALHIPGRDDIFDTCYVEFCNLVSSSTLNRYHTLDEIRGLCIGAFWLSDLSWKLSGHAVRIATEMNLHLSLQRMLRGKPGEYERAQLWYLLYVCDHHFSIAYGRPPVIHNEGAISNFEAFLVSPSVTPGDIRLMCQVDLFITLTKAYYAFGSDFEHALEEQDFAQLRVFNVDVERWRLLWQPRSADSPYVGSYPSKGVVLHYHFAKFQLNNLSLRAIPANAQLSIDRKEAANIAISSAIACLSMVLDDNDIRGAIVGVPLFTHTMVAFSAVFLLKVAWKWTSAFLNIDRRQVQDLVQKVIELMSSVTASEKHLTYHIASGLAKMMKRLKDLDLGQGGQSSRNAHGNGIPEINTNMAGTFAGSQQDLVYDTFNTYGFEIDESWNDFPQSVDFFALPEGVQ